MPDLINNGKIRRTELVEIVRVANDYLEEQERIKDSLKKDDDFITLEAACICSGIDLIDGIYILTEFDRSPSGPLEMRLEETTRLYPKDELLKIISGKS